MLFNIEPGQFAFTELPNLACKNKKTITLAIKNNNTDDQKQE